MIKGQKKWVSLLEIVINISFGYIIAVIMQIILFPLFGIEVSMVANLKLAAIFTVVSIGRSYIFRRIFNWIYMKGYL